MSDVPLQIQLDRAKAAVAAEPGRAELHNALGAVLHEMGDRPQAIDAYRQAIHLKPDLLPACFNLSIALRETGRVDQAAEVIRYALRLAPAHAEAWNDLGAMLLMQKKPNEAVEAFRHATSISPKFTLAWVNLGNALEQLNHLSEAIAAYRNALSIEFHAPATAQIQNLLGMALLKDNQGDAALAAFRQAVTLQPDSVIFQVNLSAAMLRVGQATEALNLCADILRRQPDFAGAYCNLGSALTSLGRSEEGIESFRRAIALDAELVPAHYHLSESLLRLGRFEEGLAEFEWRKRQENILICRGFQTPEWDGGDLAGKRILLHTEQGYGDAFQFVRYVRLIQQRGPREVMLFCPPELARILRGMEPGVRIVSQNEPPSAFDLHAPLMSLPFRCGTTRETIPAHVPYLRPEPARVEQWRSRLAADDSSLKIGLVWAGRPEHIRDRARTLSLRMLVPLTEVPRARWISLQKGKAAEEAGSSEMSMIDFASELHDFADTAALIENLDLIISVDTAVAHLAGAMGKPVWMMLPFVPDWRWMLDRPDSPWYPTMRLFRQSTFGDWSGVVREIVRELTDLSRKSSS